ncbi:MAG TPA: hypothetical protein VE287_12165 [Actinopolymorphaceae bacterium]|jgi:hypothetical protein|nr:hypothetical protein [Actinopolymorphaceae bacterium]
MWPAIGNFAHDFTDRLEQRTRHQIVPIPRQRNRWMVRSLRGTGTRLVLLADRLDITR